VPRWPFIGKGFAQARGKLSKNAVKQVDRLLSNVGVEVWSLFVHWASYVVGPRQAIVVAMNWADFDADGQATILLSLLTRHGRGTPLLWLTVDKATLVGNRVSGGARTLPDRFAAVRLCFGQSFADGVGIDGNSDPF
jgi:hypothetical protein